jgi:hypothetical protein
MTNLTDNLPRSTRGNLEIIALIVAASTTVYAGAAVQEHTDGGAINGTGAGTTFAGIAREKGVGGATIGSNPRIEVIGRGQVRLPVVVAGNVLRTNVGATVYITDGNLFTLDSTGAQAIGKVVEVPESEVGKATGDLWVLVEGVQFRSL